MENSQSDRQKQSAQRRSNTILQLLTDRGVLPDRKISSKKRQTARQKKQRDTFHNTLQLLQYYRKIAWLVECFPDTIAEELEQPFETVDELLDGNWVHQDETGHWQTLVTCYCGAQFSSSAEWEVHASASDDLEYLNAHAGYEAHEIWVVDNPARDICSRCGAVK